MSSTREQSARRRITRRLRHRSRSAAVSAALVVVIIAAVYLAVEAVLTLLGAAPLVARPLDLVALAHSTPAIGIGAAVVLGLAGLICLVVAVAPGRLARRLVADERLTIVVDDEVVAAGLSRAVASSTGVDRDHVRTALSRRRADVRIVPSTGFPVPADRGRDAVASTIQKLDLRPAPSERLVVAKEGALA